MGFNLGQGSNPGDATPNASVPQAGTDQTGDPTLAGPAPAAEHAGSGSAPQAGDPPKNSSPRWVVPVIAVVGLLILAVIAIGAFNWWQTGDSEADQSGWMYQEGTDENPQYGLALPTDAGFQRGPKFAAGWVRPWDLIGEKGQVEKGTVTLPKFGSGYATLVWPDTSAKKSTTTLQLADSSSVIDLDAQSGSSEGYGAYADRSRGALHYTMSVGDLESCRVVYDKDPKPFEVATGRDCRWALDGTAVATDWSRTSASFRVYDAEGVQLAAGEFPAGNYEEFGSPGWMEAGGWIWAIGTDEPAESPDDSEPYKYYNESLSVFDLGTGQLLTSLSAVEVSVMAMAEQGRGLVVAVDDHKESLDAVYLGPDGKEAARIKGLAAAQAICSQDGTQAWVAGDNGKTVTVSYLAPGAEPRDVLQPAPKAVSLLQARDDQLLMAAQGDTRDAYRVLRIAKNGDVQTLLEGKATGFLEQDSEVRTGAESAVGIASVGEVDLISAPAATGPWAAIWQLLPDEAKLLVPAVDYGEVHSAEAKAVASSEGETVVLYSRDGQEELVAVREGQAGQAVPLGASPFLTDLGFAEGKFWFNVKGSESDQWQTKKIAVDGSGPAEDVNLTLGAVAGTSESSYFGPDEFVTKAWTDPLREN